MDRFTSMSTFVQVVDSGTFSGAARRLQLSPAAVTTHIQSLEQRLGLRLLNRTTRRVSLTEEGTAFYRHCTRILAEVEEAESLASSLRSAPQGRLRLNVDVSLARLVARLVPAYVARYPDISVDLFTTDRIADLVEGQYDLAIQCGPLSDSSLIQRRLGFGSWVLCASPEYLERHGAPRSADELAAHNCLKLADSPGGDCWRLISETDECEIEVSGNLRSNSIEALRAAALSDQGICLLPLSSVAEDLDAGRLTRVLPGYTAADTEIHAVYPAGRHVSVKVRTFIDFLAEQLRRSDADAHRARPLMTAKRGTRPNDIGAAANGIALPSPAALPALPSLPAALGRMAAVAAM